MESYKMALILYNLSQIIEQREHFLTHFMRTSLSLISKSDDDISIKKKL